MVTTPDGAAVAMVHCNNCTSDLNAWVDLLAESAALCGAGIDNGALFTLLFNESLHGAPDCGGITPVNYISGESVTHLDAGVPCCCAARTVRLRWPTLCAPTSILPLPHWRWGWKFCAKKMWL